MISPDSILFRLPPQLNKKQTLFIDGIRHAVEVIYLAYSRLQHTLTQIVVNRESVAPGSAIFTAAFLDAWAFVDAVDRFRILWRMFPNNQLELGTIGEGKLKDVFQPVRDLRNIADHLAERADQIIAKKGTAFGILSWVTCPDPNAAAGFTCVIVPGTRFSGSIDTVNPIGKAFSYPTGLIHLAAGGYKTCLSDFIPEVEKRLRQLEASLLENFKTLGLEGQQAGADYLFSLYFTAAPTDPASNDSTEGEHKMY